MIYLSLIIFILLFILPIPIKLRLLVSFWDKKIFYSLKLFKIINVNSGFFDFTDNRVVLRYGNRKAKPLFYKDMILDETKTDLIKHLDFLKCSSAVLLGCEEDFNKLTTCAFLDSCNATLFSILKTYKPYLVFKNDLIMLEENEKSGILAEIVISVNGVGIVEILIKKLYGGLINLCQRTNRKIKSKN